MSNDMVDLSGTPPFLQGIATAKDVVKRHLGIDDVKGFLPACHICGLTIGCSH